MDSKDDSKTSHPVSAWGCSSLDFQSVKSVNSFMGLASKDRPIVVPPTNPFAWATTNSGGLAVGDVNCNSVKNRCDCCNKKVGLMGFWCRCGGIFCGMHRYPEEHSCEFDFKTAGRIVLAKENILCETDKLANRI